MEVERTSDILTLVQEKNDRIKRLRDEVTTLAFDISELREEIEELIKDKKMIRKLVKAAL
jgi:uncharacterized protein (UPF0335 family)